jgi:hypothetical protein
MGLLDDAIREHLDLKRRRGADPSEVERAEREALGPVRRNREAPAAEVDDDQVEGGIAYDQADEDDWAFEDADEPGLAEGREDEPALPPLELSGEQPQAPARRPAFDEPGLAEPGLDEPVLDEPAFGESAFEEPGFDDAPPPAPPPRFAHGATGAETTEFDVEEAIAADGESDEDVLEETPEFLQDTPDHDRLWFEQRPPKDFDFDG